MPGFLSQKAINSLLQMGYSYCRTLQNFKACIVILLTGLAINTILYILTLLPQLTSQILPYCMVLVKGLLLVHFVSGSGSFSLLKLVASNFIYTYQPEQYSQVSTSIVLLFLANQFDVIDIMHQGDVLQDIQVVQISSEYIIQKEKELTYSWAKQ